MAEIRAALRARVRDRAKGRCEYCLVPEGVTLIGHELDHIIAVKHGGHAVSENLALCCTLCNKRKGSDIASIDPETGAMEVLFHPRRDSWQEHFEVRDGLISGRTAVGRATVRLLQLNRLERVKERLFLLQANLLKL